MRKFILTAILSILVTNAICAQDHHFTTQKSMIVTKTGEIMGQEVITKTYSDDYGDKFAEYTIVPLYENGMRRDSVISWTTVKGNQSVIINNIKKTKTDPVQHERINFQNLSDDIIKKYHIKKRGEDEICGKPCTIYSITSRGNGKRTKAIVWIWNGVSLRKQISSFPINMDYIATDIEVDVDIDPSVFIVPDYTIENPAAHTTE